MFFTKFPSLTRREVKAFMKKPPFSSLLDDTLLFGMRVRPEVGVDETILFKFCFWLATYQLSEALISW